MLTLRRALAFLALLVVLALGAGCDDPPPYGNAGRLLTLPGSDGGYALILGDAANGEPGNGERLDAGATTTAADDGEAGAGDE